MKALLSIIISVFFVLVLISTSLAQQSPVKRSNNKVELNGKAYYIHIVRKGETLYGISEAYKTSVDTIKKDNLHLSNDLKVNQYLKIGFKKQEESNKNQFVYHEVKKGDTPYNVSVRYGVTINDLYKVNPTAKMGIGIGEILKIPLKAHENLQLNDTIPETQKEINSYLVHTVQKRETIYGIAASFKTTQEEIKKLNPQLIDKPLQIGDELKIPGGLLEKANADSEFYFHKVKKQETIYKITRQYQIKERQLYKLNSGLKDRAIMIGELVKIPKNTISDSIFLQDKPTVDSIYTEPQNDQFVLWTDSLILPPCPIVGVDTITKYKVAFFLPFYLNINDTLGKYVDIVVRDEDGHEHIETVQRTGNVEDKIYPRSKLFINFYQGALLALKNLKDMGVSIDIHVFDTQNDSLHLSQILKASKFENFDLFIGPVFGDMLKIVGDYAWEHHINIVSPLSNDNEFIDHNPYAFQVIPPLEVQMQHASDYLNSIDTKNYIVIHDGKNLDQEYISQFKRQLFAQMNNENFDQIKYNEVLYYDARDSVLKEVFTKGMENIVIVPSSNQAFVTDILGKLNGYSYEYNIKIFGQPLWSRFENIELDNFHNTNTHIFSNSFIDYSQANVSSFVQSYRYHFKGEPNKYAFQGYDITKYFCLALNKYGRDFRKCIHMHDPELLQTSYRFVPFSDQGGYQNTSIFILEYSKSNRLNKVAQFP